MEAFLKWNSFSFRICEIFFVSQGCQSSLYRAGDCDDGLAGQDAETARVFYCWNKWSRRWRHSGNLILAQVISFSVCPFCTFFPALLQQSSECCHYSAIMKTQMTQLYFNHISHLWLQFVVHNPFIDWSPFVSWLTAADNCWQIAFNAPSTGKNGIDKRWDWFVREEARRQFSEHLTGTLAAEDDACWSMRAQPDDSSFRTSFIVSTWVWGRNFFLCRGAVVFVPVLPLCSLNAAYQLTMATDRSLLIVAGLISRWCNSTLSVYHYHPENNTASGIPSKGTTSVNTVCWRYGYVESERSKKKFILLCINQVYVALCK